MSLKQYQRVKLIIVVLIAMVFSQSIINRNYLIPIATLIVSALVLLMLRKRVKEIVADERDYELGGKAALLAIQIYSWLATLVMFVLYALRDMNPAYEPIAMALAFSTCVLMLTYSLIFNYFCHYSMSRKRWIYIICAGLLFLVILVGGARLIFGEDDWICDNGNWVKHGSPSFPHPDIECKKS